MIAGPPVPMLKSIVESAAAVDLVDRLPQRPRPESAVVLTT